jgi:hypothetical protein
MAREFTLFVRMPVTGDGGWDIEESVQLAKVLKEKALTVGGGVSHQQIALLPNRSFAERIKKRSWSFDSSRRLNN